MKIKKLQFNHLTKYGADDYGISAVFDLMTNNNRHFELGIKNVFSYCGDDPFAAEHSVWVADKIRKSPEYRKNVLKKANISENTLESWLDSVENLDIDDFDGKTVDGEYVCSEDISYSVERGYTEEFLSSRCIVDSFADYLTESVLEELADVEFTAEGLENLNNFHGYHLVLGSCYPTLQDAADILRRSGQKLKYAV